MSKEAMKLALEALEQYTDVVTSVNDPNSWVTVVDAGKPAREAIAALREALADQPVKSNLKQVIELYDSPDQPAQQKPWCMKMNGCKTKCEDCPDYVPPAAQRTWVGLTESEITTSLPYSVTRDKGCFHAGALWADAKLKDKNNA